MLMCKMNSKTFQHAVNKASFNLWHNETSLTEQVQLLSDTLSVLCASMQRRCPDFWNRARYSAFDCHISSCCRWLDQSFGPAQTERHSELKAVMMDNRNVYLWFQSVTKRNDFLKAHSARSILCTIMIHCQVNPRFFKRCGSWTWMPCCVTTPTVNILLEIIALHTRVCAYEQNVSRLFLLLLVEWVQILYICILQGNILWREFFYFFRVNFSTTASSGHGWELVCVRHK